MKKTTRPLMMNQNDVKAENVCGLVPPVMLSPVDDQYFDSAELLTSLVRLFNAYSHVLPREHCLVFSTLVRLTKSVYLENRKRFLEEK